MLLLSLLAACTDVSLNKRSVDADGDGYTTDVDCDDAHATVNPDAAEVCDEVDNDCDEAVDEDASDATSWYPDADGDGYGADGAEAAVACTAPEGTAGVDGDCDDADPAYHPGADESDCTDPTDWNCDGSVGFADADGDGVAACEDCDDADPGRSPLLAEVCDPFDVDEDCSGAADDQDPGVATDGQSTFYADADGDGYGDPESPVAACDAPAGAGSDATDCDDAAADVNPAATEVCDDADLDEDCDGLSDDADDGVDSGSRTDWHADADGDAYGDPDATTSACDAPSGYVADATDCSDGDAAIHPGAAEACDAADTDEDCDGLVDDADASVDASGFVTRYADDDADGYGDPAAPATACDPPSDHVADATDCDDHDDDVHPDGVEVCDPADTDEDCDGLADDDDPGVVASGLETGWPDADGDGFGDPAVADVACDLPVGDVSDGTDCDDADAAVNPDATEVCDAADVDEDCDGLVDDADGSVDAASRSAWHADADGDAYGDPVTTMSACAAPAGYLADATDCDDAAAGVNPGATEVCDAADTDEDCDGLADDADPGVDSSGFDRAFADADGDGFGDPDAPDAACDLPASDVDDGADCDDADAAVNPDAAEVCDDAVDNDCDGTLDDGCGETLTADGAASDADAHIYGNANLDYFGTSLVTGFDLDGDGDVNLVVGASGSSDGRAYVYDGAITGANAATDHDVAIVEGNTTHTVGLALFALHDIDGDGRDELGLVSSGGWSLFLYEGEDVNTTFTCTNATFLYDTLATTYTLSSGGDFDGTTGDDEWFAGDYAEDSFAGEAHVYTHTTLYRTLSGELVDDQAAWSLGGGPGADVDGDGYDDLFAGAPGNDATGTDAGAAYVVLGPLAGDLSFADADVKLTGAAAGDAFGYTVRVAGDADDDGRADLLVGAVYADDAGTSSGAVYLFADLDPAGTADARSSDAEATIVGAAANDLLGWTETLATGDLDEDGALDVVVASQYTDPSGLSNAGAAWALLGPVTGRHELSDRADWDTRYVGDGASDSCGSSVGIADLDADGADDLVLGCGYGDEGSYADRGVVYVFDGG